MDELTTGNMIRNWQRYRSSIGVEPKDAEMEPYHPKTIEVTDRLRIVR